MKYETSRRWVIRWMYSSVVVHLIVGMLLPWVGNFSILSVYHLSVESGFWIKGAPLAARAQQVWWMSLFGPTVQNLAILMGALVHIGDRQRSSFAWGWLMMGIIIWAPQDMLVSLRAGVWLNVWVDCFAVVTLIPPLLWLWLNDRKYNASLRQNNVSKESS